MTIDRVERAIAMAKIIRALIAAYPEREISGATTEIYSRCLSDLPTGALEAAVLSHIAKNKWFPSIAELRAEAIQILPGNHIPSPVEAYAEVKARLSDTGFYGRPTWSHPAIAQTVDAMGWRNLCDSATPDIARAQFIKLYTGQAERIREDAVQLPEVRRLRQELAADDIAALPPSR